MTARFIVGDVFDVLATIPDGSVNAVITSPPYFPPYPPELLTRPILAGCPAGGTVLDPFAGSGTTLMVAHGHGRESIGIDLDARNADLARERLGMFLDVEHLTSEPAA